MLVPLALLAGAPSRAQDAADAAPVEAPVEAPAPVPVPSAPAPVAPPPAADAPATPSTPAPDEDEGVGPLARAGLATLGAIVGAGLGFSLGAAIAGGAYPLVRRDPPIAEGLGVAIGTPVALTVGGAGVGATLAPMILGDPPSFAGGAGAAGGALVVGAVGAVPGAWLTWEATKALGSSMSEPSPEGCILSLVGLSAALSAMFGGFCAGAACGGAGGGAGGALLDAPDELQAAPAATAPTTALAY
ncbi:MAG: hypothetical protein IT383_28505 [Deltaproteobacteria bacterium]|nr:hypothetical protein [Deltaproteobacteria bacterium]